MSTSQTGQCFPRACVIPSMIGYADMSAHAEIVSTLPGTHLQRRCSGSRADWNFLAEFAAREAGLLGASALLHRIWQGKLAQGAFAFEFTAREAGSHRGVGLFAPKLFKEHDTREPFLLEFTATGCTRGRLVRGLGLFAQKIQTKMTKGAVSI